MGTKRTLKSKLQKDRSRLRTLDYDEDEFEEAKKGIIEKLLPFYPINGTIVTFGRWTIDRDKQAQIWTNDLVDNARQALSWWLLRDTKEQREKECVSLLKSLKNTRNKLALSHDLRSLLGPSKFLRDARKKLEDARHEQPSSEPPMLTESAVRSLPGDDPVLGCLSKIEELIPLVEKLMPLVESAHKRISELPAIDPGHVVRSTAAVAMVISVQSGAGGRGHPGSGH